VPGRQDLGVPFEVVVDAGEASIMQFVGEIEGEMQIVVAERVLGRGRSLGTNPAPCEEMEDLFAERPTGAGQRSRIPSRRSIDHQIPHAGPQTEIPGRESSYSDRAGAAADS
jgi:hypothetical protein